MSFGKEDYDKQYLADEGTKNRHHIIFRNDPTHRESSNWVIAAFQNFREATSATYESQISILEEMEVNIDTLTSYTLWAAFWTFGTFSFFPFVNKFIPLIAQWRKGKDADTILDMDCRFSSVSNCIIVLVLCFYSLFDADNFQWWDIHSDHWAAEMACQCCLGYFMSDVILIFRLRNYYPQVSDFYVHHAVSLTAFLLVDANQACRYICIIRLLSESSTPFVNGRWMLLQLDLRDSLIYRFNRHLTYYTFLLFRICTIPFYWGVSAYYFYTAQFGKCSWALIVILFVSGIALDLLNVQWFSRLKQGVDQRKEQKKQEKQRKSGFKRSEDPTEEGVFCCPRLANLLSFTSEKNRTE
ncbi:Oidioi.mRNA.OKI2018_I69.XSR.g14178.t1.cds [Oikopleura dioica]|uniref:Oidioi.mRNA.OKI2018_I69.XSR.g14178.t1.cds n=1 Tax=Oikopleura dioica TaxID=34765 RepID=A0ABN7SDX9_OIKDI|nr:Oidioi.mRNA.OKI2018_I69.XSR.g14178.t1.cds [Oikopleura dioica]